MLHRLWHKARLLVKPDSNPPECYVTIYSAQERVVDQTIDAYLNNQYDFNPLMQALKRGKHSIYISDDLSQATKTLIRLKQLGKLANVDGAACHLRAKLKPAILKRLIHHRKDFRSYLYEADGLIAKQTQ